MSLFSCCRSKNHSPTSPVNPAGPRTPLLNRSSTHRASERLSMESSALTTHTTFHCFFEFIKANRGVVVTLVNTNPNEDSLRTSHSIFKLTADSLTPGNSLICLKSNVEPETYPGFTGSINIEFDNTTNQTGLTVTLHLTHYVVIKGGLNSIGTDQTVLKAKYPLLVSVNNGHSKHYVIKPEESTIFFNKARGTSFPFKATEIRFTPASALTRATEL